MCRIFDQVRPFILIQNRFLYLYSWRSSKLYSKLYSKITPNAAFVITYEATHAPKWSIFCNTYYYLTNNLSMIMTLSVGTWFHQQYKIVPLVKSDQKQSEILKNQYSWWDSITLHGSIKFFKVHSAPPVTYFFINYDRKQLYASYIICKFIVPNIDEWSCLAHTNRLELQVSQSLLLFYKTKIV